MARRELLADRAQTRLQCAVERLRAMRREGTYVRIDPRQQFLIDQGAGAHRQARTEVTTLPEVLAAVRSRVWMSKIIAACTDLAGKVKADGVRING